MVPSNRRVGVLCIVGFDMLWNLTSLLTWSVPRALCLLLIHIVSMIISALKETLPGWVTQTYKWFPNNRLIYPQLHQYSKTAHCVRSDMNTSTPGPRGLSKHLLNPYCHPDGGDSLLGAFLRIIQRCHLVDKHWKAFC